jgi:hypothetical protein
MMPSIRNDQAEYGSANSPESRPRSQFGGDNPMVEKDQAGTNHGAHSKAY